MPTAIDRPGFTGGDTAALANYFTEQRRRNPRFQAPAGYEWKGDHYERDTHPWYDTAAKYAPLVGLGIGGGVALAGGLGAAGAGGAGAAGAGGAGAGTIATTVPGVTMPAIASGVPAALPGAVSLGGLGLGGAAAGGSSGLMSWLSNPSNWSNLLGTAGDVGSVLGNAASGAAEGRHLDALLNNQQDAIRNQQYGTQQQAQFNLGALDLNRQQFGEQARGTRGKQAAIGNLLQNIQDVRLNVPGIAQTQISGGLRPSALGPGGRAAGGELARQAMLKLMTPDSFTGGEILTPPPLTPIPQPSGLETAGGTAGLIGNILGAIGRGGPRGTQQPPPITSTVQPRQQQRYPG